MDKQALFDELTEKLAGMGIDQDRIRGQIRQFDEYLSTLSQEDYRKELQSLSDTDRAAANIAAVLRGDAENGNRAAEFYTLPNISVFEDGASEEAAEKSEPERQDTAEVRTAPPRRPRTGRRPAAADAETVVTSAVRPGAASRPGNARTSSVRQPAGGDTVTVHAVGTSQQRRQTERPAEQRQTASPRPGRADEPDQTQTERGTAARTMIRFSELDDAMPVNAENRRMFWILFAVTLPITLSVALLVLGLFAGAFLLLAGIIAACLACLVGLSAAGGCTSLFGIVYGVVQVFSGSRPAGLYEIGFAVIIAGFTLLIGILLYNFAIRLMPIAITWLLRLFRYTVNQAIKLFLFVRRECTGK